MPAEPPSAGSRAPAALERHRDDRRTVLLLATLIAFQPLSTDLYLPSMPSIAAGLGLDAGAVQSTLSVYILGFAPIGTAMHRGLFSFLSEASFVLGGADAGPLPPAAR
jgi:DHA1 family bicyclomycin/chloramphenicol resistance-like MFS transporter